jgi:hypothetical protein
MTVRVAASCLVLLWSSTLHAITPDDVHYRADAEDLIWFLAVTDSHIGASLMGGQQDTENLDFATSTLVDAVQPSFLANLGDLVDATGGGLIPVGQFDEEWNNYAAIVDGNGMTADFYHDLPGNHDQYGDPGLPKYLANSVQGKGTGQLRHSWSVKTAHSEYLFLGLRTCNTDGSFWPADHAGLESGDLEWAAAEIQAAAGTDIVTVLGHHPVSAFEYGQNEFKDFLDQEGAAAYLFGHTHDYSMKWQDKTLHVNLASLGKTKQLQVGLFAYDGRGLSARAFDVGQWPMVLITAPLHAGLAGNHKHDYKIPDYMTQAPLRAIAFHPDGIDSVAALLDSSVEIPMSEIADHVWQGTFDATKLDLYPHEIVVTATRGDEKDSQMITFYTAHVEPPAEPGPEAGDAAPDADPDAVAEGTGNPEELDAGGGETAWEETLQDSAGMDSGWLDGPGDGTSDWGTAWDSGVGGETCLAEGVETSPSQPGVTGHIPGKKSGGCSAHGPTPAVPWVLALAAILVFVSLRRQNAARCFGAVLTPQAREASRTASSGRR